MYVAKQTHQGETVIDLGSGAGFDAFLAATKVGPNGKVIGVDMNKVSRMLHLGELHTPPGRGHDADL